MKRFLIVALAVGLSGCGLITPEGRANFAAQRQCREIIPKPPEVSEIGGIGLIGALTSYEMAAQNPVVQQYFSDMDQCVANARAELLSEAPQP